MVYSSSIFDAFNKMNVLIVGDVMIDRYLRGDVSRISPEAPVPVVQLEDSDSRLGGAANVALNVRALGATPLLCSVIGDDPESDHFLDLLPRHGLSERGVLKSGQRPTTVKTRIMAGGQQLLRVDREQSMDLTQQESRLLVERIRQILEDRDIHVILFQDYNKGVLTYKIIREVILEAIKRDIPTAVDPKFHNFWSYKHVTLFKPNLKEVRAQLADVNPETASLLRAAERLRTTLGQQSTLITLSEKGLFYETGGKGQIIPTQTRSVADVCGAGDTVISIAALGLGLSLNMEEIALLSNIAGGQVCERVGVAPVDKGQLQQAYEKLKTSSI